MTAHFAILVPPRVESGERRSSLPKNEAPCSVSAHCEWTFGVRDSMFHVERHSVCIYTHQRSA